jgi:hypothetical protein
LEIGRVDRLARDFFDAVDAVRAGPRHRIALLCFHDVRLKPKDHGEISPWPMMTATCGF